VASPQRQRRFLPAYFALSVKFTMVSTNVPLLPAQTAMSGKSLLVLLMMLT